MVELDLVAPNYSRARDRWPDAPTLSNCHAALVRCLGAGAHGTVEHVKSFVECVCLTVLAEFHETRPTGVSSTTELFVAALRPLGLENSRGSSKLAKVLSGFNKLADALTEMRNETGAVAHGREGFVEAITLDQARAFLHTGDAILGVLLAALEGREPDLTATREPYERFKSFNDRIDRAVGVEVRIDEDGDRPMLVVGVSTGARNEGLEVWVEPSRLLYGVDRSAYVEVLKTADLVVSEDKAPESRGAPSGATDSATARITPARPTFVSSYSGRLSNLRPALSRFLKDEGLRSLAYSRGRGRMVESLLATADEHMGLDWKSRETLQARLKVSLRRVFIRFGHEGKRAEEAGERLVAWLRAEGPASSSDGVMPR